MKQSIFENLVIFGIALIAVGVLWFGYELEEASKVSGCTSGLETLIEGECRE